MARLAALCLAVCLMSLVPLAAAPSPPPVQVRAFLAMHERVRARLAPADRQLMDTLCARVRAVLPRRAHHPEDVRTVLARSMAGLAPQDIAVLADYVSGDPGIAGSAGIGGASGMGGGSPIGSAAGGGSQAQLFAATQQMQEMQMSFNLQYLQLQNQMQNENRQFTMISNILRTKHDTVKNSINNVR